jgi:tetratricopeptide (TPR) repeat protein
VTGLDLEDSIARLAPALHQMRSAVHQFDGIIHREMGDGIFAVFGAPIANDLHAVMACLAALELLRCIEKLQDPSIRVRVGVHCGQVVAGPRQLDYTRMYDFDGPPLIMAERLQAIAKPGEALASESCRSLAKGYIDFGTQQAHTLKGFAEPVVVYPVKGTGELSKWQLNLTRGMTAFVGRTAELSEFLTHADVTSNKGTGAFVVVSGEPGVGKSRLTREGLEILRRRGWQSIEIECSSILKYSPFSLLRNLLSEVAGTLSPTDIAALLAELPPVQMAALEVSLYETPSNTSIWARSTPRARGKAIVAAARSMLLRRVQERPTFLLVEDLQWADEASTPFLEAITEIAKQVPLLVVATVRTDLLPAWVEQNEFFHLSLVPLGSEAGLMMLDKILGTSPRLRSLKTRILNHTGAMPLFIEEVCRGLVESGKLTGEWGAFEPASLTAELAVPVTIQGVIASRIDRLDRRDKRLLQAAAAIGQRIPVQLLLEVSGLRSEAFEQGAEKLKSASMIFSVSDGLGSTEQPEYRFAHELVRQVSYDALLGGEKLVLHTRILTALEADPTNSRQSQVRSSLLVHHAVLAQNWPRAADYAIDTARHSVGKSALSDGARYYEIALDALDKCSSSVERESQAVDLRIEARSAYANHGKVGRWLSMAEEAEARAKAMGDKRRHTVAIAVRAAALNFCGTPIEAMSAGEEALQAATQFADHGWLGYAEYGFGQACYVAGRYSDAVEVLDRAYHRFAFEGATPPLGGSAMMLALLCSIMTCICQTARGEYSAAEEVQKKADLMANKDGGILSSIASDFSRGTLMLHQDYVEKAEGVLGAALAKAHENEINLFVPVIGCQHGLALLLSDRVEEASRALTIALREAEDQSHRSAGMRAQLYLSLCSVRDVDSNLRVFMNLQQIYAAAAQQGYDPIRIEALLAEAALQRCRISTEPRRAQECETEADAIAHRLGAAGTLSHLRRGFARLSRTMPSKV